MAASLTRLIEGSVLTTSAVTYYTAPANTTTQIQKLTFSNTTGTARTVTVYLVPSGGAAGDASTLVKTLTVPANSAADCTWAAGHVLATGDFIQALADAGTAVTIMGSGLQVTA